MLSKYSSFSFANSALSCRISWFVFNVDFSKYVKGYNSAAYVYDLFGVCNHGGGVMGGHYTASIKNANGKWYAFNDTLVNEIREENVISVHSYCLFYRKKKYYN